MDRDKNGLLSRGEYQEALALLMGGDGKIASDDVDGMFEATDLDGDEQINREELEAWMANMDEAEAEASQ